MKKLSMFLASVLALMLSTWSCSYDDKDLWNAVNDLDYRVEALEAAVKSLNEQTGVLQQLLDNKLFIESVEDDGDGTRTLTLVSANGELSTIVIKDGKDGTNGTSGDTPSAPNIGVADDGSGNYYWILDGEPLLDSDGRQVPVNGTDGAQGQDGKTPTFKIEDGQWWVSFDNGLTWTGPYGKATGTDGDAFFKDATLSPDGQHVTLTLIDGTQLTLEIYKEFNIAFDISSVLIYSGQTREIPFIVTGATPGTIVEALGKDGWTATVAQDIPSAGLLKVTAPADQPGTGRVIVFAGDGADHTIMRTLTFVAGSVEVSNSSITIPRAGGSADIEVTTNLDFTAAVEQSAADWLTLVEGRAYEMHTEKFTVTATENTTPYARTGMINLTHDGHVVETILVVQEATKYDDALLVFRVDPSTTDEHRIYLPNMNAPGETVIDWGDGSTDTYNDLLTNTYVSHIYAEPNRQYTVTVKGQIKVLEGKRYYQNKGESGVIDIVQWGKMPYATIVLEYFVDLKHLPAPIDGTFNNLYTTSFAHSRSLEVIEPGLLKSVPKLETMLEFLRDCTSLTEIPEGLFDNCVNVYNFCELLKGCTSLKRLPSMVGLTTKQDHVNFRNAFSDLTSLTELPDRMWNDATASKVGWFINAFAGCTSLERVPENFFKGMTNDQFNTSRYYDAKMEGLFSGCVSLREAPVDFLINFAGQKCDMFRSMFANCGMLEKRPSPFKLDVDGTTYNVELWQRLEYMNSKDEKIRAAARQAFHKRPETLNAANDLYSNYYASQSCFTNCFMMPGYFSEIPNAWGGGWDGTSNPPRMKLTATPTPGKEYYSIDFVLKGQGVTKARYYLTAKVLLDELAPKYNNDYTAIVDELGNDIENTYIGSINTEEGLTLGFDAGVPEVEYILIAKVTNSHGQAFGQASAKTTPMPKGEPNYENMLGTWRVTSDNSTTEVTPDTGPVSFDIEIAPIRVNEAFLVLGWGVSTYRDTKEITWRYENGKTIVYAGNVGLGMGSVLATGIRYVDDFGDIYYNCIVTSYAEHEPGGAVGVLGVGVEPILSAQPDASGNTATMVGLESAAYKEAGYAGVKYRGMEAMLGMGGQGWSRYIRPAMLYHPEYLISNDGRQYVKMSLEPYTFTRIPTPSLKKRLRARQPGNRSLRLGKQQPAEWSGAPMKYEPLTRNRK